MPSGLRFQKQFSLNVVGSKSDRSLSCSSTDIVIQFLLPFPSAIFCRISAQTRGSFSCNVFILLFSSGVTTMSLLVGVCAVYMLAYRCLQMKWCAAMTVVAIPSQKTLLMCPYVSSCKFSVLAPRCSRALFIICSLHLIAV